MCNCKQLLLSLVGIESLQSVKNNVSKNQNVCVNSRKHYYVFQGTLGVAQSESALLYTILCPVGDYFTGDNQSVSLYADPSCTRSWPGGCGDAKVGSNYGPTITVLRKAASRGRQQVLWLYGDDNQVTEIGTMNVFLFYLNDLGGRFFGCI